MRCVSQVFERVFVPSNIYKQILTVFNFTKFITFIPVDVVIAVIWEERSWPTGLKSRTSFKVIKMWGRETFRRSRWVRSVWKVYDYYPRKLPYNIMICISSLKFPSLLTTIWHSSYIEIEENKRALSYSRGKFRNFLI